MCAVSGESARFSETAAWLTVLLCCSLCSPVGRGSVSSFPLLSLDGVRVLQLSMFFLWTAYFAGVCFVKRIL